MNARDKFSGRAGPPPPHPVLAVVAALAFGAGRSHADELPDLRERVDAQHRQIEILERRLGLIDEDERGVETSVLIPPTTPRRARFQLVDGNNVLRLRGVLHVDGRYFLDDIAPSGADSWVLRRVRPSLEGTLDGIYDFRFTAGFEGSTASVVNAFVAARLRPWARITAGRFKMPVGLGRLAPATDLRFMEHAFPASLVPNNGVGIQLAGEVSGRVVEYSLGYFNAVSDGGSRDMPDDLHARKGDIAARLFFEPFLKGDNRALRGLGFGIAGTYAQLTGTSSTALLPAYRTPGQQSFFSYRSSEAAGDLPPALGTFAGGTRWRLSPQAHYYLRSLGLTAEYVKLSQEVMRATPAGDTRTASLGHTAWQVQLAWSLTGEEQSFSSPTPASAFSPDNETWGAFELVARAHALDVDDATFDGGADSFADPTSASSKARAWGLAVNWYLNRHCKWSLNYDVTTFDGGAASGDRPAERALLTRFALSF